MVGRKSNKLEPNSRREGSVAAKWLQSTANTCSSSFTLSTPIQLIMVMSWSWAAGLISNDGGATNVESRLRGGSGGFATLAASHFLLPHLLHHHLLLLYLHLTFTCDPIFTCFCGHHLLTTASDTSKYLKPFTCY